MIQMGVGKGRAVEGGGRWRLAGLLAATPGAAGQTDLRTTDTSGCAVRSSRPRQEPLALTGEARRVTAPRGTRWPVEPRGSPLGEGRPRNADSFSGPASPAPPGEENKPTCEETALVRSYPPGAGIALLRLPSPGRRISPHVPRRGGNPLIPGRCRENASPHTFPVLRCPSRGAERGRAEQRQLPGMCRAPGPARCTFIHSDRERCPTRQQPRHRRPPSSLLRLRGSGAARPVRARPGEGKPEEPRQRGSPRAAPPSSPCPQTV